MSADSHVKGFGHIYLRNKMLILLKAVSLARLVQNMQPVQILYNSRGCTPLNTIGTASVNSAELR